MRRRQMFALVLALIVPLMAVIGVVYNSASRLKATDTGLLMSAPAFELSRRDDPRIDPTAQKPLTVQVSGDSAKTIVRSLLHSLRLGGFYDELGPTLLKLPIWSSSFKSELEAFREHGNFPAPCFLLVIPTSSAPQLRIEIYYASFYAEVESRSPRGTYAYVVPIKLTNACKALLDRALETR